MLILINRNNGKNLVDNKGERARASKEVGGHSKANSNQ